MRIEHPGPWRAGCKTVVAAVVVLAAAAGVWLVVRTPGTPVAEVAVARMYLVDGDEQAAVLLDSDDQAYVAVDGTGRRLWSTPPVPALDQMLVCGDRCDAGVLSSSVDHWTDPSYPDPLPRTVSASGERVWALPATRKMRVLTGTDEHDALILRADATGPAWVEIRRPAGPPERVALPTANVDWVPGPGGRAGILYEYNAPAGTSRMWRFARTAAGWRLDATDTLPAAQRNASVTADAATAVLFTTANEILVRQAGGDRTLRTDLRTGDCLISDHGYVLIQRTARDDARTTDVRALSPDGRLLWSYTAAGEAAVSQSTVTGEVLISEPAATWRHAADGTRRPVGLPAGTTASFGRGGSVVLIDHRAGTARPGSTALLAGTVS